MTQLSFIAIIASVLVGSGCLLSQGLFWKKADQDTPKWKQLFWSAIQWFDFDTAPKSRRFMLKMSLFILGLIALGCGFWDTYSATDITDRGFIACSISLCLTVFSTLLFVLLPFFVVVFKEILLKNFFNIGMRPGQTIALNILILIMWIAVFVFGIYMGSERIFSLISASAIIAIIGSLIITIIGTLGYLAIKILYALIKTFICSCMRC